MPPEAARFPEAARLLVACSLTSAAVRLAALIIRMVISDAPTGAAQTLRRGPDVIPTLYRRNPDETPT